MRLISVVLLILLAFTTGVQLGIMQTDEITLPSYRGYISVAPEGRYFVDEDGKGFLVIGQNDAISWPGLSSLVNQVSPEATENYIIDLRQHGITVSRIMIEYSQEPHTLFENPVGTFTPEMVQFWDDFIALAEKHGLYLLLTPYDTFWQFRNWGSYPYNGALGGPCPNSSDWLTDRDCVEAQKNRWRFILDRWGGSPNIFAWDIMNEIDIWWGATPDEIQAYLDEMIPFIRDYEIEKWGRAHLLTVSSAAPIPDGQLGRLIYKHPELDFANTHLYIGTSRDPDDTIQPASAMGGGVLLSLDALSDTRPYFDSESGPIDGWIVDVEFDKEYHHNMSWAHLAAGGAGSGIRWPYTTPHWILPELRDNLLGLARFASTIDWAHFPSENINPRLRVDRDNIVRFGCSDGETAILWLLGDTTKADTVPLEGMIVTIRDVFEEGSYTVEFWETYGGNRLESITFEAAAGELQITLPASVLGFKDVALIVRGE